MREQLKKAKRIVVKIGTSTITDEKGRLNKGFIRNIARQIADLRKQGREIIIVSSGAIGSGVGELGIEHSPRIMPLRQAAAAVGQAVLMQEWRKAFKKYNLNVAQIMLTYEAFSMRRTYLNLRTSIATLLKMGVIPIMNENDPISVYEIEASFGDNDKLSALIASKIEADLLVILTDVEGLYDRDPRKHKNAKLLKEVKEITPKIEKMAGEIGTTRGLGGMRTKIEAAKTATDFGCSTVVVQGKIKNVLMKVLAGEEIGTLFKAKESAVKNRKKWMILAEAHGKLIVDEGAKKALLNKRSLLPSGVLDAKGKFKIGDIVSIVCKGKEFAKGIVDYNSEELRKIKGKKTDDIEKILGYKNYDNVVRRENLALK